jgi:hypothetical protein
LSHYPGATIPIEATRQIYRMNSAAATSHPHKLISPLSYGTVSAYKPEQDKSVVPTQDPFPENWFFEKTSAFYYNERARLYFKVTTPFTLHFALLKGLIEFTRPGYLQFTYQADQKIFEIDLPRDQFPELKKLLQNVHQLLLREIQFKANLKKAIQFEERHKREMAAIYHPELMGPMYSSCSDS